MALSQGTPRPQEADRGKERLSPRVFGGSMVLTTPGFWTSVTEYMSVLLSYQIHDTLSGQPWKLIHPSSNHPCPPNTFHHSFRGPLMRFIGCGLCSQELRGQVIHDFFFFFKKKTVSLLQKSSFLIKSHEIL